jgi:hypothetical protein
MTGKLKPFTIEYIHEGREGSMKLMARSHDDAKRRMASAFYNGEPLEVAASVSVPGWLARMGGAV